MDEEELQLIQKHRTLENLITDLQLDLHYVEDSQKEIVTAKILSLSQEKLKIEEELINLPDRPITRIKQSNTLSVIRKLIDNMKMSREGYALSRDQWTVSPNAIYGYLIYDIEQGFHSDLGGFSISNYYHDKEGDFNHEKLKELLETKFHQLRTMSDVTYPMLKQFIDQVTSEIRNLLLANTRDK